MKKENHNPSRAGRRALTSGLVLGAGVVSFMHADAQGAEGVWQLHKAGKTGSIRTQPAQDALDGDSGNDLFPRVMTPGCAEMGTAADEIIFFGGSDCDTAFGLAGDDILYSYTATTNDTLLGDGGPGADYMYVLGRGVVLGYGGTEADEMELNTMKDILGSGGDDADILKGYSYNDDVTLSGDAGDDLVGGYAYHGYVWVSGGDDNDELHALAIVDSAHAEGGPGNDRIYSGSKTKKQMALGGSGNDLIYGASLSGSRNILDGGADDDTLIVGIQHPWRVSPGYAYSDAYLDGGSGNDLLLAHGGNDTLLSGGGADMLRAYSGDDLLIAGDNLIAEADGGAGTDVLRIDFSLDLDVSALLLSGLEWLDISGTGANQFSVGSSAQVHSLTGGVNALTGTAATLVVDGGPDDNVVLRGVWTLTGTGTIGGADYNIFASPDAAMLWVHTDVGFLIGVADPTSPMQAVLSPVPSTGIVHAQFILPAAGNLQFILRDPAGREVWEAKMSADAGLQDHTLDFSQIPAGAYSLETVAGSFHAMNSLLLQ